MDGVSDGAGVSLLLGLSEEVLVYLVKLARFTLTDVGHLRATCKRLCNFFDRIGDTVVNDSVFGDLSRYRPYGHWDIDLAAKSGHLEVIQLLHEDEVKRGRVTHCSNESLKAALRRGDMDMFIFIVCNRREVFCAAGMYSIAEARFRRLNREQLTTLLDTAPSFVTSELVAARDAARAAIAMGDATLLARLLPFVLAEDIIELTSVSLFSEVLVDGVIDVLRGAQKVDCADDCDADVEVSERLFMLAATAASVEALERAVSRAPVAFDALPETVREAIAERAFQTGSDAVLERLRGLCLQHASAREWGTCEWVLRTFRTGAWGLVSLLRRGRYEDAEVVGRQMRKLGLSRAMWLLLHFGATDALLWMKSKRCLGDYRALFVSNTGNYAADVMDTLEGIGPPRELQLTEQIVDVTLSIMEQLNVARDGSFVRYSAREWYEHCFQSGDLALLRQLCERVDVGQVSRINAFDSGFNLQFVDADAAAAAGHYDMVAYMIDANESRHAGVQEEIDTLLLPSIFANAVQQRFHPVQLPFNLTHALDAACRAGHFCLARMIARRLPGQRVSLSSAIQARRWRFFHWALEQGVTDDELRRAFLAAVRDGRLDFVRWFESNRSDVVEWSLRSSELKKALAHVRDMRFVRAILEKHQGVLNAAAGGGNAVPVNYDTFALERALGIEIIRRPFCVRQWALAERRDVLQAAIDFGVRTTAESVSRSTTEEDVSLSCTPFMVRWLKDNADKFVIG